MAVLEGLHALGKPPDSIVSLILGTTTTTNAAVQHKGAAGDPRQRDLELITRDIADCFVSRRRPPLYLVALSLDRCPPGRMGRTACRSDTSIESRTSGSPTIAASWSAATALPVRWNFRQSADRLLRAIANESDGSESGLKLNA
jgi:hypothetical protein